MHLAGATPVHVDIRPTDLNIDVSRIPAAISSATRAIVVVPINGRAVDIDGLEALASAHGLPILEDAAQALGSRHGDRAIGTFFSAGCLSLAPSKVISTGQGGLIFTDDSQISEKVMRWKDHGRLSRSENEHPVPGGNFKFTDLQAAIGLAQLEKLDHHLKKARSDFSYYQEQLGPLRDLEVIDFDVQKGGAPLWVDLRSSRRDEILKALNDRSIQGRAFWPSLHSQWIGGDPSSFPESLRASREGFWLPNGPTCPRSSMERVCAAVKEVLN